MQNVPLGSVYISAKTKRYVSEVLKTKRLSYGPFCQKFEHEFAKLHECTQGIVCNSGTAALHTILTALKIRYKWHDGDEIIVPAVTFVATINVVIQIGLKPVLVDVDQSSFNMDPSLLEKKINKKTRAIIPVHVFGRPAEMDKIVGIAKKHKLLIIEDCCEALAASHQGKKVGSFGIASAFSTYSAHLIATGIGGIITTNDSSLAELMQSLINHGRNTSYLSIDDDDKATKKELASLIQARFSFEHLGYSYRLSEFEAAVGLSQLEDIDKILNKRQKNTEYLMKKLSDLDQFLQLPKFEKDQDYTLLAFPILLTPHTLKNPSWSLEKFMLHLEARGIETRPLLPILGQPVYKNLSFSQENLPIAEYCTKAGCYFGMHQDLSRSDLKYLPETIHEFFR
ncbi:MAG: hypothetical protein COU65_03645 [Candidatus Pacebacteria bacterium CG10_big_fil_rev_8_21_14_0_10_42_12]|nr:MAG: hypothetical protein COU65_03645 [Candidatus Pacebacteria bacterium CG10_big_fil_rev_8_21_14_0_10_42_12]